MADIVGTLKNAWERLDPTLLKEILSEDCKYYETPFSDPIIGIDAVIEQWTKDLAGQTNVRFQYKEIMQVDNRQVINWNCIWSDHGQDRKLDGIFYLESDGNGKLSLFRQWFMPEWEM